MGMRTRFFLWVVVFSVGLFAYSCSGKKEAPAVAPVPAEEFTPPGDLPARVPMNEIPLPLVEEAAQMIQADAGWFQQVKDRAAAANMPVEFQLKDDARFFLFEHQAEYGVLKIPQDVLDAQIAQITSDDVWMALIRKQAGERGITEEECIRKNALYMIDQRMMGK